MHGDDVFDFVDKIGAHNSPDDLLKKFRSRAVTFGYDSLIVMGIGHRDMEPMVMLDGCPEAWLERYAANHYADIDPMCLYATRTKSAFDWREVPPELQLRPGAKRVMNEAAEFGMRSGFSVPCSSRRYWLAAVVLTSRDKNLRLSRRDRIKIAFMSLAVAGAAERLNGLDDEPPSLTLREREVLTRTASGQTAAQLAESLGISYHTVIAHLEAIRRKFGVTTTIQAAVEGIRRGLIFP